VRNRGISIPLFVAVAIVLVFSGQYAWRKYRLHEWTERARTDLSRTRSTLTDSLKASSYPVFTRHGTSTVARGEGRGLVIHATSFEEGDDVVGSILASETVRDVATFLTCEPTTEGRCSVTAHRLYMDTGKPLGPKYQYVATLYHEHRTVEIGLIDLPHLDKRLEAVTDATHDRLARSVARVRFAIPKRHLHSPAPHVTVEVQCLQPELDEANLVGTAESDIQVTIGFAPPKR